MMNLWSSPFAAPCSKSTTFHVLVIIFSFLILTDWVDSNPVRHQRHRQLFLNHTHNMAEEMQQQQHEAMSTGGCSSSNNTNGPDCLASTSPNSTSPYSSSRTSRQVGDQVSSGRNNGRKKPRGNKCLEEREERQRLALLSNPRGSNEYIPTCRSDGSYATVQCHLATKSCWCVSRGGRPVQGSAVLLSSPQDKKRPNCSKYLRQGKSSTSTDRVNPQRRSSLNKNNRKSCNYADRSRFNAALIRTFKSEYNRYKSSTMSYYDAEGANDEVVLSWKFDTLDRNRDGILYKNETLMLKHLVKQQIQPRSCAKNFISFCAKGDQKIVKREWLECLRLPDNRSPIHPSILLKPGSNSDSGSGSGHSGGHNNNNDRGGNDGGGGGGDNPFNPLRPGGGIIETQDTSNCWTDRQSALASQIRNESVIIPECTLGGLYHKVQCAQGKTYCWCVEEESGIQIPNTLVVNSVPDCNKRYSKAMKGCSGQKKQKFLTDLLDNLIQRMTASINEGFRIPPEYRQMSIQEQSARWYFSQLDLNSDGILERPEWKHFRAEVSKDKRLKKCGKKLPRHCDVNSDRRLNMSEWVDCLGVELFTTKTTAAAAASHTRRPAHRSNGRRNGKNPFAHILKQR